MTAHPPTVSVSEHFVISAVRYALGRATYIVGVTVDEVIRVWPQLSDNTRLVIVRDISGDLAAGRCGHDMDRQEWNRLIRHATGINPRLIQIDTRPRVGQGGGVRGPWADAVHDHCHGGDDQ